MIDSFSKTPLSNFFFGVLEYNGVRYSSSEAAYQAAKCVYAVDAEKIRFMTPSSAKIFGGRVKIRPDWESVKLQVMEDILAAKFKKDTPLAAYLISTAPQELVEGNYWHDDFWGDCHCSKHLGVPGLNHLGRLLMERRARLMEDHEA